MDSFFLTASFYSKTPVPNAVSGEKKFALQKGYIDKGVFPLYIIDGVFL